MGKFAHVYKCICAIVALGIMITGLAAQIDKATETTAASINGVFTASMTEDYTDPEAEHATICRAGALTTIEVSKETAGTSSGETIVRRLAAGAGSTEVLRNLTILSMILVAACYVRASHHEAVQAQGHAHLAEQTIISYIHSQGNFIG